MVFIIVTVEDFKLHLEDVDCIPSRKHYFMPVVDEVSERIIYESVNIYYFIACGICRDSEIAPTK